MKTEKQLQNYLKEQCKEHRLLFYKFASPARRGVPDVMIIHQINETKLPDVHIPAKVRFVELKSPAGTGRLHALQCHEISMMRDAGVPVHVISTKEEVDNLMKGLSPQIV